MLVDELTIFRHMLDERLVNDRKIEQRLGRIVRVDSEFIDNPLLGRRQQRLFLIIGKRVDIRGKRLVLGRSSRLTLAVFVRSF